MIRIHSFHFMRPFNSFSFFSISILILLKVLNLGAAQATGTSKAMHGVEVRQRDLEGGSEASSPTVRLCFYRDRGYIVDFTVGPESKKK